MAPVGTHRLPLSLSICKGIHPMSRCNYLEENASQDNTGNRAENRNRGRSTCFIFSRWCSLSHIINWLAHFRWFWTFRRIKRGWLEIADANHRNQSRNIFLFIVAIFRPIVRQDRLGTHFFRIHGCPCDRGIRDLGISTRIPLDTTDVGVDTVCNVLHHSRQCKVRVAVLSCVWTFENVWAIINPLSRSQKVIRTPVRRSLWAGEF
mmetsp:Transcript_24698/g.54182  ORF Transcript_24698/g.54182 Transcript_24698/m.54182 type:complete len:206 (-) Transcript_24698:814-1431(-)